jgi:hypothetical protein
MFTFQSAGKIAGPQDECVSCQVTPAESASSLPLARDALLLDRSPRRQRLLVLPLLPYHRYARLPRVLTMARGLDV